MFEPFAGGGRRGTLTIVFNGVGWGEVVVLLLIGLFVFGPDRLPRAARDAGRMLRQFRQMANGMRNDLRSELGPELADLDLRDLHPKTFVRKHLFEGDDDSLFPAYPGKRTSFDSLLGEDEPPATPALTKAHLPAGTESSTAAKAGAKPANRPSLTKPSPAGGTAVAASSPPPAPARVERAESTSTPPPFDPDTT